jgi:hypothetical protein
LSGNEPVRTWLRTLPLVERPAIGKDIRKGRMWLAAGNADLRRID